MISSSRANRGELGLVPCRHALQFAPFTGHDNPRFYRRTNAASQFEPYESGIGALMHGQRWKRIALSDLCKARGVGTIRSQAQLRRSSPDGNETNRNGAQADD
jgi:hypothetical protein